MLLLHYILGMPGLVIYVFSTSISPRARDEVMTPLNALPELANALSGDTPLTRTETQPSLLLAVFKTAALPIRLSVPYICYLRC